MGLGGRGGGRTLCYQTGLFTGFRQVLLLCGLWALTLCRCSCQRVGAGGCQSTMATPRALASVRMTVLLPLPGGPAYTLCVSHTKHVQAHMSSCYWAGSVSQMTSAHLGSLLLACRCGYAAAYSLFIQGYARVTCEQQAVAANVAALQMGVQPGVHGVDLVLVHN